ncbi:murein L,D-transpeptidase [Neorhizobium lilium]|uniref:Murein L,D-transpeptidase n=1 Tax=Neorhizobium lilium TaxID=2503024 RepID=A0A444LKG4_9HYPH|nr:L,D-transpeptidase [Neorhizobium lilium]RWX80807.1 murein L,D-transpeptidase [Neorhizobium lilium]
MNKTIFLTSSLLLAFSGAASAQQLTPDMINTAAVAAVPTESPVGPPKADPAVIHLQVLLDRAGSSPGVIDGFYGANVSKAIAGFEAMQRLPVDGKPDPDVLARLTEDGPAIKPYKISEDDPKDLVDAIPKDYAEQAKMKHLGYTRMTEKLAERFHMDEDLLKILNATSAFKPGDTISVADPGASQEGKVKRIEARRKAGQIVAFADDGSILAVYPATIGSEEMPSPSGTHKVNGVARMPVYEYNPKINFQQGKNKQKLTLPSGPNNPVGTVWIDLSEPTYGIHGTPEPSLIDKSGSHGCVRLTNWDVEELSRMVKPGVVVDFID